ncbi:unnamed protein product [Ostreobium quekettii]|uniref:Small ribosomal subunit protein mS33 n=1 Tax=Ostreobium quekettii TaxID=121088 RepID=A0A8S1J1L3_9CHLO|nr:unnamed protein product [Ostreobium quekettii]
MGTGILCEACAKGQLRLGAREGWQALPCANGDLCGLQLAGKREQSSHCEDHPPVGIRWDQTHRDQRGGGLRTGFGSRASIPIFGAGTGEGAYEHVAVRGLADDAKRPNGIGQGEGDRPQGNAAPPADRRADGAVEQGEESVGVSFGVDEASTPHFSGGDVKASRDTSATGNSGAVADGVGAGNGAAGDRSEQGASSETSLDEGKSAEARSEGGERGGVHSGEEDAKGVEAPASVDGGEASAELPATGGALDEKVSSSTEEGGWKAGATPEGKLNAVGLKGPTEVTSQEPGSGESGEAGRLAELEGRPSKPENENRSEGTHHNFVNVGGAAGAMPAHVQTGGGSVAEETMEQIRARVFGYHIGNNLRSGRKVLRKKLVGWRIANYYLEDIKDPLLLDLDAEAAKEKLAQMRRRGKGPPKKGEGKRAKTGKAKGK